MTRYELTTIVADESAANPALTMVEQQGGIVIREEAAGKRRFTYPINGLSSGVYHRVTFDADTSAIAPLDAALRHDATLLRHLIVEQRAEPAKPAIKVDEADIEALGDVQEMTKAAEAEQAKKAEATKAKAKTPLRSQGKAPEGQAESAPLETEIEEAREVAVGDESAAVVKDESVVDEATRQTALDEKLADILGPKKQG